MRTRIEEKEVFSEMSRQALAGRTAATETPPFWLFTVILPPMLSSVTPANDVLTSASPLTLRAVTDPLLFSTVRFPLMRSAETLPKLVLANVSPPISVSVMLPLPVTARIPLEMSEASIAPKEDFSSTAPWAERRVIFPLDVSAFRAPAMLLNSRFPKESRTVTELPDRELPETRPLLVVQLTRPFTSEKVTFPKLSVISAAPPIEETSTLPLLSCTIKSPRILRASTLPNELLSRAEPVSRTLSEPWLLSNSLLLRTPAAFTLPKLFFTNSGASDGIAMS